MRPIEAAYDLYGGRLQVFRLILLPLALPGIIAGCLLVFIPIPGAFNAPVILGGGRPCSSRPRSPSSPCLF